MFTWTKLKKIFPVFCEKAATLTDRIDSLLGEKGVGLVDSELMMTTRGFYLLLTSVA
jgi:hypothetical protein